MTQPKRILMREEAFWSKENGGKEDGPFAFG
jgi:hypothetical protein